MSNHETAILLVEHTLPLLPSTFANLLIQEMIGLGLAVLVQSEYDAGGLFLFIFGIKSKKEQTQNLFRKKMIPDKHMGFFQNKMTNSNKNHLKDVKQNQIKHNLFLANKTL